MTDPRTIARHLDMPGWDTKSLEELFRDLYLKYSELHGELIKIQRTGYGQYEKKQELDRRKKDD